MTTLSLAMIVKNEEAHLAHCLGSVKGLVDQMVVLDTGSSDRTVAIARDFGAKVGEFTWCQDFAAARNASLRACTGDWVLVLDADEAIDAADHGILRASLEAAAHPAFHLPIRNYLPGGDVVGMGQAPERNDGRYAEGRGCDYFFPFQALRLCRNAPDLAFEGAVHELLDPYWKAHGSIGACPAVIHHYGKLDAAREQDKAAAYLRLAEADVARDPGNLQFHYNVMTQARLLERWDQVLSAAKVLAKKPSSRRDEVGVMLALALIHLGRPKEALPELERIPKASPHHPMALHLKGMALARTGKGTQARASLRLSVTANPNFAPAFAQLAALELEGGRPVEARAVALDGLERHPKQEDLWLRLVQADLALQRPDLACQDAARALSVCPSGGQGLWHWTVALGAKQAGRLDEARAAVAQGLALFPANAGLQKLGTVLGSASA